MRILTICPGLGLGGTERSAQEFTLGFREAGHDVAVLNIGMPGPRAAILEARGIPVFTVNGDLDRTLKDADQFSPDIIHIHRRGWHDDREAYVMRRLRGRERRILEQNIFGSVDHSDAANLIDVHLQLSRWCMWRWRRMLGRRGAMTPGVIVPNPVNPHRFRRADDDEVSSFLEMHGIDKGAYVCGRVGQPFPGKWHVQTLLAFSDLAKRDSRAYLLLAGMPDSLQPALRSLPQDVQRRIIQMPMTPDDEALRVLYSSLDCFIHAANQGESFGLVLAEAMLCGCPVVTVSRPHRDNSQVEVVGHMEGGIVAGSMNRLPAAVRLLRQDEALRLEMRRKCRSRVLSRYNGDMVVRRALRVAELALAADDRTSLLQSLAEDTELSGVVDDREIDSLLQNTLGKPSLKDMLRASIMHMPFMDRARGSLRRLLRGEK